MSSTSVLYTFRRCPYAMRARMALAYAGIAYEHREVDLKQKPEAMLQVSSKGTVPVLVLADGTVIDESLDIMLWALALNDPTGWLALNSAQRIEADRTISAAEQEFKPNLDGYKYQNHQTAEVWQLHRNACEEFLQNLEAQLNKHLYLFAERLSFGDIALLPFIRQFANVDPTWFAQTPYPALQRWLESLLASETFTQVMAKYKPWQAG